MDRRVRHAVGLEAGARHARALHGGDDRSGLPGQHHQSRHQPDRLESTNGRRASACTPPGFRSPTAGIERLEENLRVIHLSDDEIRRLIAGAAAFRDRRFLAYVHLLHDTGARTSEILLRRWRDVDLDNGQILAQVTKTGRPRVLFFTPATAELMRRVWPKRDAGALLFEGRGAGCPITFRRSWRELSKAIGRPDLRQHDMRHHVAPTSSKGPSDHRRRHADPGAQQQHTAEKIRPPGDRRPCRKRRFQR